MNGVSATMDIKRNIYIDWIGSNWFEWYTHTVCDWTVEGWNSGASVIRLLFFVSRSFCASVSLCLFGCRRYPPKQMINRDIQFNISILLTLCERHPLKRFTVLNSIYSDFISTIHMKITVLFSKCCRVMIATFNMVLKVTHTHGTIRMTSAENHTHKHTERESRTVYSKDEIFTLSP